MRVERNSPGQRYYFWDWLRTDGHLIRGMSLFFAYPYYLMTTEEV